MKRFPALEDAGIRTLFCGPESFTDDISPMLGESPEVDGLYLACGLNSVGILIGRRPRPRHGAVADRGVPADRPHRGRRRPHPRVPGDAAVPQGADRRAARLPAQRPVVAERHAEGRVATFDAAPFHEQHVADGAYFVASNGWEYPEFFSWARCHADRRVGLQAGRGVRAHPRRAPQRARERRCHRHDDDVELPGAGPARDAGAEPGLRQRHRHRGRTHRLHPVARRARRHHRRRHRHASG